MLNLPPAFIKNIHAAFEDAGREWLERLPAELRWCAERWDLRLEAPFGLSFNYVTAARRADGSAVVLKLGVPGREWHTEAAALRLYGGVGAARLLDADAEHGALLLERLIPGTMLAELGDDERMTEIAAGVMGRIWQPPPSQHQFPAVADWAAGLDAVRQHFAEGALPIEPRLLDMAQAYFAELLHSQPSEVVLHGDLHHFNILQADQGWKLIDPKGLIGEPAYELGAFLLNPNTTIMHHSDLKAVLIRRIDQLCERLDLQRQRVVRYAVAHAVLSGWWDMDAQGRGGELALTIANILAEEA